MKSRKNSNLFLPVAVILIVLLIISRTNPLTGLLRGLIRLLIGIGVLLLIVTAIATVFAINSGKSEYEKRHPELLKKKKEEKKPAPVEDEKEVKQPEKEEPEEIKGARALIASIDQKMDTVADVQVITGAKDARCSALRVIDTICDKPEDIKKNRQLFTYYLPTFENILEKYIIIEQGGVETAAAKEKTVASFEKLNKAFENMYTSLYSDDVLDLSVETRALESIIRKDGLS